MLPSRLPPLTGRQVSGGKINVSKVDAHHLIWKMEGPSGKQRGKGPRRKHPTGFPAVGGVPLSGLPYGLPAALPDLAAEGGSQPSPQIWLPRLPSRERSTAMPTMMMRSWNSQPEMSRLCLQKERKRRKAKTKQKRRFPSRTCPMRGCAQAVPRQSRRKPEGPHQQPIRPEFRMRKSNNQRKRIRRRRRTMRILASEKFREQEREAKAKEIARNIHRKLQ